MIFFSIHSIAFERRINCCADYKIMVFDFNNNIRFSYHTFKVFTSEKNIFESMRFSDKCML